MSSKFEKLVIAARNHASRECSSEGLNDIDLWLKQNQDNVIGYLFDHENRRISERTKIIAYCVAAKLNVSDSNRLLRKYHREELYIRNLSDIAIMRTLELGRSAGELCDLMVRITPYLESIPDNGFFIRNDANGKPKFVCTVETMEAYLDHSRIGIPVLQIDLDDEAFKRLENDHGQRSYGNSAVDLFYEKKITREMTDELKAEFDLMLSENDDSFVQTIKDKIELFSVVRERTRREFVRSLCDFAKMVNDSDNKDEIYALYMNVDTEPDPKKRPISFKSLSFDVNEFYQGHLFGIEEENHSDTSLRESDLPESKEDRIAWMKENTENEDIEQEAAQKKCAKLLQGLLQGKNDISRTLFLAILLYFSAKKDEQLSIQKLNAILSKCGWRQINVRGEDAFDLMVVDILDYYSNKDITYSDYLDIMLQDLEEPVFEKYEGDDSNMTMNEAMTKTLR